jgi:site-specific recombinase XerD
MERSRVYTRPGKRECSNRQNADIITRNRAIILLLLDTGLRASELVGLLGCDVDMRNRRIHVVNGKGDKDRLLPFSANTAQAIQRYLMTRADDSMNDPLFVTLDGFALDRISLRRTLHRLGQRAGVADVHPHRFRHTFAIQFLRNGGNMYVLQMLLGHSTLEMCRKYLLLAQTDADETHKRASPVSNWRL